MGYSSYKIVGGKLNGQWGGYAEQGPCGQRGCPMLIHRGTSEMCGTWPHDGGDGTGCGRFFCEEHLHYVGARPDDKDRHVGSLCDDCYDTYRDTLIEELVDLLEQLKGS